MAKVGLAKVGFDPRDHPPKNVSSSLECCQATSTTFWGHLDHGPNHSRHRTNAECPVHSSQLGLQMLSRHAGWSCGGFSASRMDACPEFEPKPTNCQAEVVRCDQERLFLAYPATCPTFVEFQVRPQLPPMSAESSPVRTAFNVIGLLSSSPAAAIKLSSRRLHS